MLLPSRTSAYRVLGFSTLLTLWAIIYFSRSQWGAGSSVYASPPPQHQQPAPSAIPKKFWYKLGPKGLSEDVRKWTDTCIQKNTGYKHEFMTDDSGDDYVRRVFADRPETVETYMSLQVPILKADLLRYMILYAEGGIWSDLDVSCEGVPADDWVPPQYRDAASLVVGWEFDVGWGEGIVRQFASWTIMAKPKLPHLATLIDDIVLALREKAADNHVGVAELDRKMVGEVVDMTGPRRLTRNIFRSLESTFHMTIDHDSISKLTEPKLVGDVLVLPGYAFAASSNTYEQPEDVGPPLVTHHYAGTWKNEYGGEQKR